jgi:8-oxo-dGTP pyrophosphatase MutT (NUDIX family)
MTTIKKFDDFSVESRISRGAAGIAIIWGTKILLIHPTNSSWQKRTIGIPKGGIDPGESPLDAAIRETFEETGIQIRPEQLQPSPESVDMFRKDKFVGSLIYYICRIQDPSEIGLTGDRVPKEQLQLEEIDWAGFMEIEEAYEKMVYSQLIILDRARS